MLIKVTEQHITLGKPWAAGSCPVALALTDALGLKVFVYRNITCDLWEFPTPAEVFQQIQHYDRTGEMIPFDFEIPCHIIGGCAVQYQKDGNQWVATFDDFTNLQESPIGFGDTKEEAFAALRIAY